MKFFYLDKYLTHIFISGVIMNINNSTDTYNVDNSSVTNNTTANIRNKMIQTCGASAHTGS